jgi:hypothetical protein
MACLRCFAAEMGLPTCWVCNVGFWVYRQFADSTVSSGGYGQGDSQSGVTPAAKEPPNTSGFSGASGGYQGPLQPGGYYIRNVHTGTALDLSGAKPDNGTSIIGYQVTSGQNQIVRVLFLLVETEN